MTETFIYKKWRLKKHLAAITMNNKKTSLPRQFALLTALLFGIHTFALPEGAPRVDNSTRHEQGSDSIKRLNPQDFGLIADGQSDDGPAIRAVVKAAVAVQGPVTIAFPPNRVIAVKTGTERYVFNLKGVTELTIDGNNSEFRLDPDLRFINLFDCEKIVVENLKIDFAVQPTAPATVMGMDQEAHTIDVLMDWPDYNGLMGGPTEKDGEQAFFGMLLMEGPFETLQVRHFYVYDARLLENGLLRVQSDEKGLGYLRDGALKAGETRIGLPVPGVAHRHGPGALCVIDYCAKVLFQNVEVWSAPWFSFTIYRNRDLVRFDSVNIRPRPGSSKVLSSCRDAFHAKGNRGRLEFENCILSGLGDDSFNIATHTSRIRRLQSECEIEIQQHFPIQYIPILEGDTLVVMNPANNEITGRSRILSVTEYPVTTGGRPASSYDNQFEGNAPVLRLKLDQPLPGIEPGMVAFSRETTNPDTLIRGCRWDRSARLQSNVLLEDCDIKAFTWFYGARIEGPGPEWVQMRNNRVRTDITFSGWEGSQVPDSYQPQKETAHLQSIVLQNNVFWGRVRIANALQIEMINNQFPEGSARQTLDTRASGPIHKK